MNSRTDSEELALAPCERESLILAAVAPWRTCREPPYERWTDRLDGWCGYGFERAKMPPPVLHAIERAYPLPQTFAEARAEHEYWTARDDELGLILDTSGLGYGDTALDVAAGVRAEIVRDMAEHGLPAQTLLEVYQRFQIYRDLERTDEKMEEALFRDVERLALAIHLSNPSTTSATDDPSIPNDRRGQIQAALDADPSRSDRDIARTCRCSPTTVGRMRHAMGLVGRPRSVQRGAQTYQATFDFAGGRS